MTNVHENRVEILLLPHSVSPTTRPQNCVYIFIWHKDKIVIIWDRKRRKMTEQRFPLFVLKGLVKPFGESACQLNPKEFHKFFTLRADPICSSQNSFKVLVVYKQNVNAMMLEWNWFIYCRMCATATGMQHTLRDAKLFLKTQRSWVKLFYLSKIIIFVLLASNMPLKSLFTSSVSISNKGNNNTLDRRNLDNVYGKHMILFLIVSCWLQLCFE